MPGIRKEFVCKKCKNKIRLTEGGFCRKRPNEIFTERCSSTESFYCWFCKKYVKVNTEGNNPKRTICDICHKEMTRIDLMECDHIICPKCGNVMEIFSLTKMD